MDTPEHLTLEALIKELILADLRHSQLIFGLEALQLTPMDYHFLNLYRLVANWMGFRSDLEMDVFMEIYQSFMYQSTTIPVSQHGLDLKPMAAQCYLALNEKAKTLNLSRFSANENLLISITA
jgi:hypothetical protein